MNLRFSRVLSIAVFGVASVGCGRATSAPRSPTDASVERPTLRPLSPTEFPSVAEAFLRSDVPDERGTLVSLVRYQLLRARALFARGERTEALRVVEGALLLPAREHPVDVALEGQGDVLLEAAHETARRGDLGRARAFYSLAHTTLTDLRKRAEVEEHLEAIARFETGTAPSHSLLTLGERAQSAVALATIRPEASAQDAAADALVEWLGGAVAIDGGRTSESEDRELAYEAYRAARTAAPTLIAVGLMRGDPSFALTRLDDTSLSRAIPGGMRLRLEAVRDSDSREALLDLYRFYDSARKEEGAEGNFDPKLGLGAAFGAARSLYARKTERLDDAMPLAMVLGDLGMPEVAAPLLSRATRLDTPPEALAWSVGLLLRSMMELGRTGQGAAARALYEDSARVREVLEEPKHRPLAPAGERLTTLLANIQIQEGHLDVALALLGTLRGKNPSAPALLRLADLEAHLEKPALARETLLRAHEAAEAAGDVGTEALAFEHLFVLCRDQKDLPAAERYLGLALARALSARGIDPRPTARPGIERLLGRILEHYGERAASRRAFERALEAAQGSPDELALTLTDIARSALTIRDGSLSRFAASRALDEGIDQDQRVYIGLWHKLTLRELSEIPDSLAPSLLFGASPSSPWAGEIRRYALGRATIADLRVRASSDAERAETDFYAAFGTNLDRTLLAKVATSPSLDLVEVRIAKDLLAPKTKLSLPTGVTLP